ncbi:MAG TPA: hypothetical protein VHH36_00735 [Candidatus Thermoplasmatota archaeon]|nr:hypothetical protein [Candidatus Thermoplasmatota archaeon]
MAKASHVVLAAAILLTTVPAPTEGAPSPFSATLLSPGDGDRIEEAFPIRAIYGNASPNATEVRLRATLDGVPVASHAQPIGNGSRGEVGVLANASRLSSGWRTLRVEISTDADAPVVHDRSLRVATTTNASAILAAPGDAVPGSRMEVAVDYANATPGASRATMTAWLDDGQPRADASRPLANGSARLNATMHVGHLPPGDHALTVRVESDLDRAIVLTKTVRIERAASVQILDPPPGGGLRWNGSVLVRYAGVSSNATTYTVRVDLDENLVAYRTFDARSPNGTRTHAVDLRVPIDAGDLPGGNHTLVVHAWSDVDAPAGAAQPVRLVGKPKAVTLYERTITLSTPGVYADGETFRIPAGAAGTIHLCEGCRVQAGSFWAMEVQVPGAQPCAGSGVVLAGACSFGPAGPRVGQVHWQLAGPGTYTVRVEGVVPG